MSQHSDQDPDGTSIALPPQPPNHSPTLTFWDLVKGVFQRLKEGPTSLGPRLKHHQRAPKEHREEVLDGFFSRWRRDVGNDIYPAMRLILPHVDRERSTYGLKEQVIGKRIIKVDNIPKNSEHWKLLDQWKNPGTTAASRMAGDFAGRCFVVINERMGSDKQKPSGMLISEVNELLDGLAASSREADQLPIFEEFYYKMCPVELEWLIRIILRQMKINATERTVLAAWHPDASVLFNINSSLPYVCWRLWNKEVRLEENEQKLEIMHSFLPQLAQFSNNADTWDKIVEKLNLPDDNPEFWMEEKLDGERMQMHVQMKTGGGYEFKFWSRKGKDYTYLYGNSIDDNNSALTRHLENSFRGVVNCILDGEMIGFDPKKGKMVTFGTLKTAALHAQANPDDEESPRPLFRIFDLVLWNNKDLTRDPLWNRRKSLELITREVPGRFEVHPHLKCTSPSEIEPYLRKIIQESSEGLVLKNPQSVYSPNERNGDWIKVKPDYMMEFGEDLDCVIIGGYYGTGRRGGILSSFLCGLRASKREIDDGTAQPEKFYSFFKVGGGIKAEDYADIQRLLPEDKWQDWNPKRARQYIELAGGERYLERPDQWIRPSQSIVIQVKAASVEDSTSFSARKTLRFPRFRSIRTDKTWTDALDIDEWNELRFKIDKEVREKKIEIENKKKKSVKRRKRDLTVEGNNDAVTFQKSKLFEGMSFFIEADSHDLDLDKTKLQHMVRENGGSIAHHAARVAEGNAIALADRRNLHIRALLSLEGVEFIINPKWVVDCIKQQDLLPFEDEHLFAAGDEMRAQAAENTDQFGDSYHRNLDADEMRRLLDRMRGDRMSDGPARFDRNTFYDQLEAHGHELPRSRGYMFRRCRVYLAQVDGQENPLTTARLETWVLFGCGELADDLDDGVVTHVVVVSLDAEEGAKKVAGDIRTRISKRESLRRPYVVTEKWMERCWEEETLVAEEPYFN